MVPVCQLYSHCPPGFQPLTASLEGPLTPGVLLGLIWVTGPSMLNCQWLAVLG